MFEILIVDDASSLCKGLKAVLEGEGYTVRIARNGEEALKGISAKRPDLVLLDVMMPKMNGFRCCEEIRKVDARLPVIFLTGKDSDADLVRGIGLGADDYISKLASDAVLLARIRRALDRVSLAAASDTMASAVRLGGVTVDLKLLVVAENGKEISRLTKTEADILRCLDAQRGELVVIDDIITDLRGNGFACEDAMLYTHVSRLRAKLGKAGALIATTRGVGYSLLPQG